MLSWYDPDNNQWYDEHGDAVEFSYLLEILDEIEQKAEDEGVAWIAALVAGQITVQEFLRNLYDLIQNSFMVNYLLGVGGIENADPVSLAELGEVIALQYSYAYGFASDLSAGALTPALAAARVMLYARAARRAYWIGTAAARDLVLPAYPRDGSSECQMNDLCHWRIVEYPDRWECFWELSSAEHCNTCVARNSVWYPYVYYKQA